MKGRFRYETEGISKELCEGKYLNKELNKKENSNMVVEGRIQTELKEDC